MRTIRSFLFLAFFLLATLLTAASSFALEQAEYNKIQDLTNKILQKYPPGEYYYVGIGTSPTPIMAFMEASGIQGATSVPLSGMMSFFTYAGHPGYRELEEAKPLLFQHFQRTLPSKQELKGKKILLIDFGLSGGSLANTKFLLEEFFTGKKVSVNITALSITNKSYQHFSARHGADVMIIDDFWFAKFYTHGYRQVAKYQRYNPLIDDFPDMTPRKEYLEFQNEIWKLGLNNSLNTLPMCKRALLN